MVDERRYQDHEVEEILDLAVRRREGELDAASGTGLTLREIQEIARDAGIDPDRIAAAASALDVRRESQPRRTMLGAPIGVGRVVELPRAVTDREWEVVVSTLNARFRALGSLGVVGLVTGFVLLAVLVPEMLAAGGLGWAALAKLFPSIMVAGAGAASLAWAGRELPRWAGVRESQMEAIGERARALLSEGPDRGDEPG
jgi:hypothetical protein